MARAAGIKIVLNRLSTEDLRELLGDADLKVSGLKADQVERLVKAAGGDLEAIIRMSGWGTDAWNAFADEWYRLPPRKGFAAIAKGLLGAATPDGFRLTRLRELLEYEVATDIREDSGLIKKVAKVLGCGFEDLEDYVWGVHGGLSGEALAERLMEDFGSTRTSSPSDDQDLDEADDAWGVDYGDENYRDWFRQLLQYRPDVASRKLHRYQEEAVRKLGATLSPEQPQILHLATGGGKTFTSNEIAREWRAKHGGPVLWVTKDWRLLLQAAEDVALRVRGVRLARIGGASSPLAPMPEVSIPSEYVRADIIYSTLQTIGGRQRDSQILSSIRPTLVVWDECHWGETGRARRILTACKRMSPGIPVLGLTATPRVNTTYDVAFSRTFHDLARDGFLATPREVRGVRTDSQVQIEVHAGEVTRATLRALALDAPRNERIIRTFLERKEEFGKTIVFACGVEHSNELARRIDASGVPARAVHSKLKPGQAEGHIQEFRDGKVQVLVNMDMLTHGIDVPDAKTVFLCRPTASDILFAQMIGRAARTGKDGKKTHFNVVEFTDNMERHADVLWTAKKYFAAASMDRDIQWSSVAPSRPAPAVAAPAVLVASGNTPSNNTSPTEEVYLASLLNMLERARKGEGFSGFPDGKQPRGEWSLTAPDGRRVASLFVLRGDERTLDYRMWEVRRQISERLEVTSQWREPLSETPEPLFRRFADAMVSTGTGERFSDVSNDPMLLAAALERVVSELRLALLARQERVQGLALEQWLQAAEFVVPSDGERLLFPDVRVSCDPRELEEARATLEMFIRAVPGRTRAAQLEFLRSHTSGAVSRTTDREKLQWALLHDQPSVSWSATLNKEELDRLVAHLPESERAEPRSRLASSFPVRPVTSGPVEIPRDDTKETTADPTSPELSEAAGIASPYD